MLVFLDAIDPVAARTRRRGRLLDDHVFHCRDGARGLGVDVGRTLVMVVTRMDGGGRGGRGVLEGML